MYCFDSGGECAGLLRHEFTIFRQAQYFLVVKVFVKPYVLSFKQRVNYTLYFSKPCVAFKDHLILWLGLGRCIIGERAL